MFLPFHFVVDFVRFFEPGIKMSSISVNLFIHQGEKEV